MIYKKTQIYKTHLHFIYTDSQSSSFLPKIPERLHEQALVHVLPRQVSFFYGDHPLRPDEAIVRLDRTGRTGQDPSGNPTQVRVPRLGPHPVLQGVELVLLVQVLLAHVEVLHEVLFDLFRRGELVIVVFRGQVVAHVGELLVGGGDVVDVNAVHEQRLVALAHHELGVGLRLEPVLGGEELQLFVAGVEHGRQLVVDGDPLHHLLVDGIAHEALDCQ